jgi:hypothetical protein
MLHTYSVRVVIGPRFAGRRLVRYQLSAAAARPGRRSARRSARSGGRGDRRRAGAARRRRAALAPPRAGCGRPGITPSAAAGGSSALTRTAASASIAAANRRSGRRPQGTRTRRPRLHDRLRPGSRICGRAVATWALLVSMRLDGAVPRGGRDQPAAPFAWMRSSSPPRLGRPQGITSRSAARDCCSLTKGAVSGSSPDGPLACALDDRRQPPPSISRCSLTHRATAGRASHGGAPPRRSTGPASNDAVRSRR